MVVIPDGPHAGRHWRASFQPLIGLIIDELDRCHWRKVRVTLPAQFGKTLLLLTCGAWIVFEHRQKVVFGIPDMNMAENKWREDIEPMLRSSRLLRLLVQRGAGSRGGMRLDVRRFRGAGSIKFMSAHGSDAKRSGYTARGVIITELDKQDTPSAASDETDPVGQYEARTGAWGDRAWSIGESTPSTSQGRIWREIKGGTDSVQACPCPHCRQYVTPERQHLVGWQGAASVLEAEQQARFACPGCGVLFTEDERRWMNENGVLVHRGQRVEVLEQDHRLIAGATRPDGGTRPTPAGESSASASSGCAGLPAGGTPAPPAVPLPAPSPEPPPAPPCRIVGEPPATDTLGVRGSAFNNLFWTAAYIARLEWRAANDPDDAEASEKYLRQFVWALPYDPPTEDLTVLTWREVLQRTTREPRGGVPASCRTLVAGADVGKHYVHWVALAYRADGSPHIVDYGVIPVYADQLGIERAQLQALGELRRICEAGWQPMQNAVQPEGGVPARVPAAVLVDSGSFTETVYEFCRQAHASPARWRPSKGLGVTQAETSGKFRARPTRDKNTLATSPEQRWALVRQRAARVVLAELDADHWKSWVHARLRVPRDQPGAMTLFTAAEPKEHAKFAYQVTAERALAERSNGRDVVRWVKKGENHWLDALVYAAVAGAWMGERLARPATQAAAAADGGAQRRATDPGQRDGGWIIGRG